MSGGRLGSILLKAWETRSGLSFFPWSVRALGLGEGLGAACTAAVSELWCLMITTGPGAPRAFGFLRFSL